MQSYGYADGSGSRITNNSTVPRPADTSNVFRVVVPGGATSSTGDGSYMVHTGGSGETWVQEGAETWESFYILIPNGTNPSYPGT
jgi:hypothetical protein